MNESNEPNEEVSLQAEPKIGEQIKKKKKKKEQDKQVKEAKKEGERIRAAYIRSLGGILATVLSVVLTVALTLMLTRRGAKEGESSQAVPEVKFGSHSGLVNKLIKMAGVLTFTGVEFEASGVAAIPDQDAVLIIDHRHADKFFWVPLNEKGEQVGQVEAIPLGVSVQDPQGITQLGSQYIVIGSLSSSASGGNVDMAIVDLDATTRKMKSATGISGLRQFLLQNVPELKDWATKSAKDGGLTIGGIAVDLDPQAPRILVGLGGPLVQGSALVVAISKVVEEKPWSIDNLRLSQPNAFRVSLGGQAIREIRYDYHLKAYQIISGPDAVLSRDFYELWEWVPEGGTAGEASPHQLTRLDSRIKPHGLTRLKLAGRDHIFIVGDNNSYTLIEYAAD